MPDKTWKSVIGVDLGKQTGIACVRNGETECETFLLTGSFGQRYAQLYNHLVNTRPHDIDLLIYEEPPYVKNMQVYNELSGYEAVVILFCENFRIPWHGVNNRTLKKIMCGDGRAEKEQMRARACELAGLEVPEFKTKKAANEAQNKYDAILLAYYGLQSLGRSI